MVSLTINTYERWRDGKVVERVLVHEGSYEDTRLGLVHMEGGEWRLEGTGPPAADPEPEPALAQSAFEPGLDSVNSEPAPLEPEEED